MGVTHNQIQAGARRELAKLLDVARKGPEAGLHDRETRLQAAMALLAFSKGWLAFRSDISNVAYTLTQDGVDLETLGHRYDADPESCYQTDPRDVVAVLEMLLTARWLLSRNWRFNLDFETIACEVFSTTEAEIEDLPALTRREAQSLIEDCHTIMENMGSAEVYMACPDPIRSWLQP